MNDLLHSFPGQEKNEPVFVFARQYWVAFLPTAFVFFFLIAATFFAQATLAFGTFPLLGAANSQALILFFGGFQLFVLLVFLVALLDFYFDLIIVTDRRLVDIDQEQLFYRRISELALEDVEDASSIVKGFFPSLFNYGTVEVQTAGAKENFVIHNILHPREVTGIILDLADQAARSVPEAGRRPEGQVIGSINGQLIRTPEELEAAGAILPEDVKRFGNAVG